MYEQLDLKLIGSRIKAVRTSRGMSQADLAVKASVSLPLISNIERGKTSMQLETFVKVAEALQVSADHLLRADGGPQSRRAGLCNARHHHHQPEGPEVRLLCLARQQRS